MGISKNNKTSKFIINKNLRVLTMYVIGTLMVVILLMIWYTISKGKFIEQKIPSYTYVNKAKVDYQVVLLPNNLYLAEQKSLGEGNVYIKKLTKYIEANLKYEFNGQAPAEIQGQYNVKAVMEGQLGSDGAKKSVWKYEEQITPAQSFKINNSKQVIEIKAQINPQKYEGIAKQKSAESDISFNTKLTVYWDIQVDVKTDKGSIHEEITPTMEIPINDEKYFEIKGNLTPAKSGAINTSVKVMAPLYKEKIILFVLAEVICLAVILFLFFCTTPKPEDSYLSKRLKKIFKEHGDRLVRLVNENLVGNVQLINVKDFEDLVRIADDIGRPIFYKDNENYNEISTFYVFDEGYVYILQMKEAINTAVTLDDCYEGPVKPETFVRY